MLGSGFMACSIAQRGLKLPYMPKRGVVFYTFVAVIDLVKVSCNKNIIFFFQNCWQFSLDFFLHSKIGLQKAMNIPFSEVTVTDV